MEGKRDKNLTLKAQAVTCLRLAPPPQHWPHPQTQNQAEGKGGSESSVSLFIYLYLGRFILKVNQRGTFREEVVGYLRFA